MSVFDEADIFLITTNSFVKKNGRLVMGAGIAKAIRDRFQIDGILGEEIKNRCGHLGEYNVLCCPQRLGSTWLCAFQVKYHFANAADLQLIWRSTQRLKAYALNHPALQMHLNFPGIGNGKLDYEAVKPIVDELPDNVNVWTFR